MDGPTLMVSLVVTVGLFGVLVAKYSGTQILVFTWASGLKRLSIGCGGALCLFLWWGLPLYTVVPGGQVATLLVCHVLIPCAVLALVCIPLGTLQMLGASVHTLYGKLWASSSGQGENIGPGTSR